MWLSSSLVSALDAVAISDIAARNPAFQEFGEHHWISCSTLIGLPARRLDRRHLVTSTVRNFLPTGACAWVRDSVIAVLGRPMTSYADGITEISCRHRSFPATMRSRFLPQADDHVAVNERSAAICPSLPFLTAMTRTPSLRLPQARQPNALLVVVDDMGFSDCQPFGGEIETPHLQALVTEEYAWADSIPRRFAHRRVRCCSAGSKPS